MRSIRGSLCEEYIGRINVCMIFGHCIHLYLHIRSFKRMEIGIRHLLCGGDLECDVDEADATGRRFEAPTSGLGLNDSS